MSHLECTDKHPLMVLREPKVRTSSVSRILRGIDYEECGESISSNEQASSRTALEGPFKKILISGDSYRIRENEKDSLCVETDSESRRITVETTKTKKKKKRRYLTICTSNCKYEVVRRVATRFGMKEVTEDSSWNLYWTDLSISIERAKDMKRFQKVNHFPGMTEICRKDLLARNLNRMLKLFPKDYNFFPKTWCFPADHGEAIAYSKLRRAKTYIIKPDTGCQGRGIYLTKNLKDVKPSDRMICQVYISRPYLIDGYKFDLRIYTLITSCDPLRIYVYNDGLARFATSRYKEPTGHNTSNVFMHLTNYAVNKHSRMYIVDEEIGSKRKISTLLKWLKVKDVDVDELWHKIDEIIIKTILAAYPVLKHSYRTCFPTHDRTYACFELLGFDVLLDWKLKPYLLEVNHSPSFHTDAQIDKDIKEALLVDTFEMLNLQQCDKRKIMEEDRKRVRDRLLQGVTLKDYSLNNDSTISPSKPERSEQNHVERQSKWEDEHAGNFRRIYPCKDGDKYQPFFKQCGTTVFQETVASRAREEASKVQREENEIKIKEQESKKITGKWYDHKLSPESPNGPKKLTNKRDSSKSLTYFKKTTSNKVLPPPPRSSNGSLYSFEPEIISESEERERVTALAQRDFLLRSYGILEQIYMAMKKNGTLRDKDVKKYGIYGRLAVRNEKNELCGKLHNYCQEGTFTNHHRLNHYLTCNEAPIYLPQQISRKFWTEVTKD
ncbi:hypothetical protein KPH14_010790 [Odynerus spinipes]|uniref:Tubulin polyglutamylase TTLL13 n=1 Tax=Odynerus spinipes TaxID=1348599 RepID=A0AAD9RGW8_9HYME|nr:hypothetical protein KPH14_010790 [Odynerus spinipes]